jgi:predicted TIM-barrel fold metal-dependent hydrolase
MASTFVPSAEVRGIRGRIRHPVVDADGHHREFAPLVREYLVSVGDGRLAGQFDKWVSGALTARLKARAFWGTPVRNVVDRVSCFVPGLLYSRLDEIGLDFALLYPTMGLNALNIEDTELRQALCRALNRYNAEVFDGYRDRLEPAASIPANSPEEAIAELDYATGTLGLKAVVMNGVVPRATRADGTPREYMDTLGHGSPYDYDPLWQRCQDLGVAPVFHGLGLGWGTRQSQTNYVYNHVGSFAAAQEATCRSIFMGGVTRRFPALRLAFLEGGVAWASQMLADLIGHFEKRNIEAIRDLDPSGLDVDKSVELFEQFATGPLAGMAGQFRDFEAGMKRSREDPSAIDDFAEARVHSVSDIISTFTTNFFFGCEADDPLNGLAFSTQLSPHRARLNAMLASDVGHWDVPDMSGVLPEAWELVDHGQITEEDFRDFAVANVVRMLTDMKPDFFDGTAVADVVRPYIAAPARGPRAGA